jgi:hypothetical protein
MAVKLNPLAVRFQSNLSSRGDFPDRQRRCIHHPRAR